MRPKQQQTPEKKLPQMLQKTTKTTTNAGDYPANVPQLRKFSNKRRRKTPANVPKNGQNSNKTRRKNSRKCSTITQIQQQTPEKKLPQMFHIQKNKKYRCSK